MRTKNPYLPARNKEIKKKRKSGLKPEELANIYKLTIGRICQICKEK